MNTSKAIAYILHGHDNDSYMLRGAHDLIRCQVCGEILERPSQVPDFRLGKKLDISSTYDGYLIASQKFVDAWLANRGHGMIFDAIPCEPGYFSISATRMLEFDVARRRTRFEGYRECCNHFYSVTGATPAFLKTPGALEENGAVRTDVMFGSGDEKHPLIIIPLKIGKALKRANLSGIDFSDVLE